MDSHEIAAKERAEKFVGRTELRQQIYEHCTSENVENNTMVVNGWMGNGKTSLMAYVATMCIQDLRPNGDFVFLHIVDSCSGSSILLNMLKRLHQNLSIFIGGENPLQTTTELKTLHVSRIEETAKRNPNKKFIIFVDAINQFSSSMQAHSMWWLPSRKAPKNLRVIISTLWDTGDTYENALKRCPTAVTVRVPKMLKEDSKEMVIAMLKRHDLEITTEKNDDSRVGNQMEKLLNKNQSPLYLKTAVEGMRTKWIMADEVSQSEAHTIYIENLPLTTEELFEKLLDSWAGDFGCELIRWLMTIIALARDGVKESMLTDLLIFVENKYSRIAFKHSLRTVLDYIRGFLSSESYDDIRFFHEVLNHVVLEKYGKRNYEPEVRDLLVQFFLKHIKQQIFKKFGHKPTYYDDCLSEVVFHQTSIRMFAQDWNRTIPQVSTYNDTLRNILFIKERIVLHQEMELLTDFRETAQINMGEEERSSLSDWQSFTQFYWPYIKKFPQWAYSFSINQRNSNAVAIETKALTTSDDIVVDETFPLKWLNKPDKAHQSGKTLRCVSEESWSCCANQNLLAFGCDLKAFICDQTTGDIVHQVKVGGSAVAVHFSPDGETLWVGNNYGEITVWDTRTGEQIHEVLKVGDGEVLMIEHINDASVVCGTGGHKGEFNDTTTGTIAWVDTTTLTSTRTVSTQLPGRSYCYYAGEKVVLSGHVGIIICWDVKSGKEVKRFDVLDTEHLVFEIFDMCAHNSLPFIVFAVTTRFAGEIKLLNLITGEHNTIVRESSRWIAQFDHTGDNIICTCVNFKTIQIYDLSGVLMNTIRIHGSAVHNISSISHPCSFVSAGFDGGKLHIASTRHVVENTTQVVTWCELLPNNKELVTLGEGGEVRVYDVSSLHLRASVVVKFDRAGRSAAVHPSGKFMLVCTNTYSCAVDLLNVEIVHKWEPSEEITITIMCVQFTSSGDKCVVLTRHQGTYVYKVHSMYMFEHLLTFTGMKDNMMWCDVTERQCVSGGDSGIVLWDTDTGEILKVLRTEHWCRYVKFLNHQSHRILYHIWEEAPDGKHHQICIMNMDGNDMMTFDTKVDAAYPKLHIFDKLMITAESDGSLRLHLLSTGEILYVFVDEQSLGFNAFLGNPATKTISCYNGNGQCYDFEITLP